MKITTTIIFALLLMSIQTRIYDSLIFLSMNEFLNPETSFYRKVSANPVAYQRKYQCLKRKGLSGTSYHSSNEINLDTGSENCGWEISKVTVSCSNGLVSGIRFFLRDILNKKNHKSTSKISAENNKSVSLADGHYIKGIDSQYSSRFGGYLTGLKFTLNTGKHLSLSCGVGRRVQSKKYSRLSRVTGFFGVMDKNRIKSLDFYFHYLNLLTRTRLDYYQLIRENPSAIKINDKFIRMGMIPDQEGQSFEDPYLHGHWKLHGLTFGLENGIIKSLQSICLNVYFHYAQEASIHGKRSLKNAKVHELIFEGNTEIANLKIYTGSDKLVCGMEFVFNNKRKSELVGCGPKTGGILAKEIEVLSNQEILGFYGRESEKGIESLGALVLQKYNNGIHY